MSSLVYALSLSSVLLPHMYMDIPIEHAKKYHMYKERRGEELPLAVVYSSRNHPLAYGCTAMITAYNAHANKVTVFGLERFQKNPSLYRYGRTVSVRYIFDKELQKENVWVKQLRIIECLEFIAHYRNIKIDMRNIRNIRTPEFSFTIATSQFFNPQDRYRLLKIRTVSKRLDVELELLNSRFAVR